MEVRKIVLAVVFFFCLLSGALAQEVKEGNQDEVSQAEQSVAAKPLDWSLVFPMTIREERTVGERLGLHSLSGLASWQKESTGPLLATSRFFACESETFSVNYWLVSDHDDKDRPRSLNEKNRGFGFFYSCDGWSAGYDRMKNSNDGKAELVSVFWGDKLLDVDFVSVSGKVGYGRIAYGVPRHNVTLRQNSKLAFLGLGVRQVPGFSFNIARVPKTAGKAYIFWMSYEVVRFKR